MSADNYLAIRKRNKNWVLLEGNASSGYESERFTFEDRDKAIDKAQEILEKEFVEYGISVIEPKTPPKS